MIITYYTPSHTAYVSSDTGTTLKPIDVGLQNAPVTISSFLQLWSHGWCRHKAKASIGYWCCDSLSYGWDSNHKMCYSAFLVSAATHNGDIAISRTVGGNTYDVRLLFENGVFTNDLTYTSNGTPRVVDADGNAAFIFSNHFKDVSSIHTKMTPCLLVSIELNICLLQHLQIQITLNQMYQHLKVNLVIKHKWYCAYYCKLTHVYVKEAWRTSETPETHNPKQLSAASEEVFASLILQTILRLHY